MDKLGKHVSEMDRMDMAPVSTGPRRHVAELCKRALALLLSCTVPWASFPAWAQVALASNAQGQTPGQQVAANGVPVVDIVAPNAKGVSHNRYNQFDVGTQGLILNNSAQISRTELGGYVAGNDNLKGAGPALLILNEVSSTRSRLDGYVEIAGSRAQLVIANPNGISCNGCGFLNTSRVTLATGRPHLGADGALTGFDVGGGTLEVGARGLDASGVDRLDLLSRQLGVAGSVWAQDLNGVSGGGRFSYDGLLLEALPATEGGAPAFGIDVAQLGGMYANRIRLIATEAGVGVVSKGTLAAQAGDLRIDSSGQVSLDGATVARDALAVAAAGALLQDGTAGSQTGDVSLRGASMALRGDTIAAGTLDAATTGALLQTGRSSAGALRLAAAELAVDGNIYSAGTLALNADGLLRSAGTLHAGGNASLQAEELSLSGMLQSGASLALDAGRMGLSGTLDAADTLDIRSTGSASLAGLAQGRGGVQLLASALDNRGSLISGGALRLQTARLDNRAEGMVSANGALSVDSASTDNAGTLYARAGLDLRGERLDNAGQVYSAGAATLALRDALDNRGSLVAADALRVDTAQLASSGDLGSQRGALALRVNTLALSGNTVAGGAASLQAQQQARLEGSLSAATLAARSGGDLVLSGSVRSTAGGMDLQAAGRLDSSAVVSAAGELRVQADAALRQRGQLQSLGALALQGDSVDSDGVLDAGGSLQATAVDALTLAGTVQARDALVLQAGGALDSAAQVVAGGPLSATAAAMRQARDATLSAGEGLQLQVLGALENAGQIHALGGVDLRAHALQQDGRITSAGNMDVQVQETLENTGSLVAHDALAVRTGTLRSSGQIGSEAGDAAMTAGGDLALSGSAAAAGELRAVAAGDLRQAGALSGGRVSLSAGRDLVARGTLQSAGTLDLRAGEALSFAAQARSEADASLQADQLQLEAGSVLQSGAAIAAEARVLDSQGSLDANGDLRLVASDALALGGIAQAGGDVALRSDGQLSATGQVIAGRDLRIDADGLDNAASAVLAAQRTLEANVAGGLANAGTLQAGQDLRLQAAALSQAVDAQAASAGALQATVAGRFDNAGRVTADGALTIEAGQLHSSGQLGSRAATLEVAVREDLRLDGLVVAATDARLQAGGALDQAGTLRVGGDLWLASGRTLQADGSLETGGALTLAAQDDLLMGGQLLADGAATLHAGAGLRVGADAVLQTQGDLALDAATLQSLGTLDAGRDLRLSAATALALAGIAQAGRDVVLEAGRSVDNGATVVAGRDLRAQAAGVGNTGALAAQGELRLQADALLDNSGLLQAGQGLALHAGSLRQRGSVQGGGAIQIATTDTFDHQGSLVAGAGLSIQATDVRSRGQLGTLTGDISLVATRDIELEGNLAAVAGSVQAQAGGDLRQRGALSATQAQLQAGRDLSLVGDARITGALALQAGHALALDAQALVDGHTHLEATEIAVGEASTVQAGGDLSIAAAALDSAGDLAAAGDLAVRADTMLLAGALQSGGALRLQAHDLLANRAQVVAGQGLQVQAGRLRNAQDGTLAALGALDAHVDGALENAGLLQAGTGLRLQAAQLDQIGRTHAGDTLEVQVAGSLDNRGTMTAATAVDVHAGQLLSSGELGSQHGAVTLWADQGMQLGGKTLAGGALQASAGGDLAVSGALQGQSLALDAGRDLTLAGTAQSQHGLQATAQRRLALHGQASAGGDLALTGAELLTDAAALALADGDLTLQAGTIDSRGGLRAGRDLRVLGGDALTLGGVAQSARDLSLQSGGTLTIDAQVYAQRALDLRADQASLGSGGTLGAAAQVALTTTGLFDNAGRLAAGTDLSLQLGALRNSGSLYAGQGMTLAATGQATSTGTIVARDALALSAASLDSQGSLGSEQGEVQIATTGDTRLAGIVSAGQALHVDAGGDLRQDGSASAQSLVLSAGRDAVFGGSLHAVQSADLQAQRTLQLDGQLGAASARLGAGATLASGQAAQIRTTQSLALDARAIDSRGTLEAGTSLDLQAEGDIALAGALQAGTTIDLDAGSALRNAAQLRAGSDLTVDAASLDNRGMLAAQRDLSVQLAGQAGNAGGLLAGRMLALEVGSLSQQGQAYGAQGLTLSARGSVDNQGDLIGGQALRVTAAGLASSGRLGSESGDVALRSHGDLRLSGTLAASGAFEAQADGALSQSGTLSAASLLRLDAGGDLTIDGALDAQQVDLDSGATLRQRGSVRGQAVALEAARLENAGQTVSAGDLSLRAGDIAIGGTVGAGIAANGELGSGGTLSLVADRTMQASGTLLAGRALQASGQQLQLAGSTTRVGGNATLSATGAIDHRNANLLAGGTLATSAGGTLDNAGGSLQANQLTVNAAALGNAGGRLVQTGGGDTRLVFDGGIDNRAGTIASNGGNLTLAAASLDNSQGRIEHAGAGTLDISSRGALGNAGGRVLTQGRLALSASGALDNQSGTIAAAGDAGLTAASLSNVAGSIAARDLAVTTSGGIDNRNGLLQASVGALTLRADSLANAGGTAQAVASNGSGGGLWVELAQGLDNGNGSLGASGQATLIATNIANAGGSVQAGGALTITARGQFDNHQGGRFGAGGALNLAVNGALRNGGGQLDAGTTLTASAGSIDNAQGHIVNNGTGLTRLVTGGGLVNTGGNLGGRGSVVIDAASIGNNNGQLVAGGDLTANTNALDNQGGNVYAGGSFTLQRGSATLDNRNGTLKAEQAVRLDLQSLSNAGGRIGAGSGTGGAGDVVIATSSFDGGGSILAQNLLDLTLHGDYVHRAGADLSSNGDFFLRVGGNLSNEATLKAARVLDISAGNLFNRGSASILANDTRLGIGGTLDNAGSVSGNTALSLRAGTVSNTGSIVGGNVLVDAGTLVNGADLGGATDNSAYGSALLGSTGSMTLLLRDQLLNRDARIFSLGNIAIGAARDGGGTLTARTGVVNNVSGSIEADGSVLIAANQINNRRRVVNTATGPLSAQEQADANAGMAEEQLTQTPIRNAEGALAPSPYTGKSPGVWRSYNVIEQERLLAASAEGRIAAGGNVLVSGSIINNASTIAAAGTLGVNQYGVAGLSDAMIAGNESVSNQALALNRKVQQKDDEHIVTAITNDCMQPVGKKVICYYEESTEAKGTSTSTTSYNALAANMTGGQGVAINGANISNGAVGLDGRSISGAQLAGSGGIGAPAQRGVERANGAAGQSVQGRANAAGGSAQVGNGLQSSGPIAASVGTATRVAGPGGLSAGAIDAQAQHEQLTDAASTGQGTITASVRNAGLSSATHVGRASVTVASSNASVQAANQAQRGNVNVAAGPVQVVGGVGAPLSTLTLPLGGLYRLASIDGATAAALGRAAGALGGINAYRGSGPVRRYLIETDPRFVNYDNFISSDYLLDKLGVDPEADMKRLGDGFYEQRLVLDQITDLTGRRYLGNYEDGVAQYRALLEAGVAASNALQLSVGVGLSAAQVAALTEDIVWMVEQEYAGQKVLVPVVYLASSSLQLRSDGALIAGGTVDLNATGSLANQGAITGTDVLATAGSLLNQGRIAGSGAVVLQARDDLLNLGGQIQGQDVALSAGNALRSEALAGIGAHSTLGAISAGNSLALLAGGDLSLSGTKVAAGGNALLAAAGSLLVQPGALREDAGLVRGGEATSIQAGGNLQLQAGNDLQLRGVAVEAGGSAALVAGGTLSLSQDGSGTRTRVSAAEDLQLSSGKDLLLRQVEVSAGGDLVATAARDLTVESVLEPGSTVVDRSRQGKTQVTTTTTRQALDVQALNAGGNLVLAAGNDVNLVAAQLQAGQGMTVVAGNDLNVAALTTTDTSSTTETRKRFKQVTQTSDQTVHGTSFQAGSDIVLQAGHDATLTAATVSSEHGGIALSAGNDVNLLSAQEQHDAVQDMTEKKKGTFSSKTTTTHDEWHDSVVVGTALDGQTISIAAGNDLAMVGSTALAEGDVRLAAGNDVTIESAQDSSSEAHSTSVRKSGLTGGFSGGVASIGYSESRGRTQDATQSVTQVASAVGSQDGDVVISAGNRLTIAASDVGAGQDLTLAAKDIALLARQDTADSQSSQASKSSGFSVGVTYDPAAAYRSARDSATAGMADSGSTLSKASRDAEGASAGTMAALTPVVIQAGSQRANAAQNGSSSDARVSQLSAGGNLTLLASDGSITSQGAQLSAEGNALLLASQNIVFDVAHNTQSSGNASAGKGWGFNNSAGLPFGNYNQLGNGAGQTDTITGTQLSVGGNASLSTTGGDIVLTAGNIVAEGDVGLHAAGDLTLRSGQDTLGNGNRSDSKGIGTVVISDTERFAGYNAQRHRDQEGQVSQVASSVGSLKGDVSLSAGDTYSQIASNVVAAQDIAITAAQIEVTTAEETGQFSQSDEDKKFGVFARIKSPLIDLINNVDAARQSDGRLQAMQGMAAAANAYQSASAISAAAGGAGSGVLIAAEAGVGFKTASSSAQGSSTVSQGSTLQAGGNLSLTTTSGDIHVVQGNLSAGDKLSLDSAQDILLEAGKAHVADSSRSNNAGVEVGVGVSVGAQTGVYVYAEASAGSSKSNSDSTAWQNTTLTGRDISLKADGDTTLRGATATADRIDVKTGGALTIESLQDLAESTSKNSQVGGRVQVSFGTAWDVNGYASSGKANGNYQGVGQQSGLFAGDGGYHVDADTVNLTGGAIASTNAANSALTAQSLTFSDLQNQMQHRASSGSISGGYGGKAEGFKPTTEGGTPNFGAGVPMAEKGGDSSTTHATLTEGNITLGGKQTTAAELGINTDASVAHMGIKDLPNAGKLLADQQAMAAAMGTVVATSKQLAADIGNQAMVNLEKDYVAGLSEEEKARFNDLTPSERAQELQSVRYEDYKTAEAQRQKWGIGSANGRALEAVTTLLIGAVSGQSGGQVAANALAPYAAQLIGEKFDANHGSDPNAAAQALSHALLGAVLAEANGASLADGALAGAGGELAARYLTKTLYGADVKSSELSEQEEQTILALSQAVGALVGGMTGGVLTDAVVGSTIAKNSSENNHLSKGQEKNLNDELAQCEKRACPESEKKAIWEKWKAVSDLQEEEFAGLIVDCDPSSSGCPTEAYLKADVANGSGLSLKGSLGDEIRKSLADDHSHTRLLTAASIVGAVVNSPGSSSEASADLLVNEISGTIDSLVNKWNGDSDKKNVKPLQSGYDPNESIKPYAFVEINGVSYPVYTYEDAKKLPPGKGAILTTQGGDQRSSKSKNSTSANYDAATSGAMSDISSGQRLVFALRYDNNVNGASVGGRGVNVVRFDGFDIDEGALKPIDGKTNSYSMQPGTKFNRDVKRQQEALGQNGIEGIWEMPTDGKSSSASNKLRRNFPDSKIKVRTRK